MYLRLYNVYDDGTHNFPLTPERRPVLLLLLAHERADVLTLTQLETLTPQEHVHGVEVEVRVGNNECVEVVGQASHVKSGLARTNRDVAALVSGGVVLLLVNAVEHLHVALEEGDDLIQRLETRVQRRRVGLGKLEVFEGCDAELDEDHRLHAEGQHVTKCGIEDFLVRRETTLGLFILGSAQSADCRVADALQHRDSGAVEVVCDRVGHGGRSAVLSKVEGLRGVVYRNWRTGYQ